MKRFIGFLMMVLFIGAFTGFGNTIADLSKNSEKVITVSADSDFTAADVIVLKMVESNLDFDRAKMPVNLFLSKQIVNRNFSNYINLESFRHIPDRTNYSYNLDAEKLLYTRARDKLSC